VIGNLGRRATELVVLLFALLGFAFVPLGQRTALEHLGRILSTGAAAEAAGGLADAFVRLRARLVRDPAPAQAAIAPLAIAAAHTPDAGTPDASLSFP
jgi:hypothetical protein